MPVDTARRGEHGFSLVESVIAVAVLGIIVTAMVGGMATSIGTSALHRDQSVANTVMVSAAEKIKNAGYSSCASTYSPSNLALPPGVQINVSVQYWNPNAIRFESTCHDTQNGGDGLGGPFPMQLVTILVTSFVNPASASGDVKTSVDIIKRGP